MTDTRTDFDRSLDELFGRQEDLDEACRALPKRSRSLAELRERDVAVFFADRAEPSEHGGAA